MLYLNLALYSHNPTHTDIDTLMVMTLPSLYHPVTIEVNVGLSVRPKDTSTQVK